ncbi:hypothetical protein MKZ38_006202 [Zalerion maritima]|uniref:Dynein light intermediate chain n=1 Tax=Zalerion maritima TaxID=339359 RepID=A0AAD5RJ49_9PEZI|nr:hypothetical protein MKZ38_006202 [Zalerion maritima]
MANRVSTYTSISSNSEKKDEPKKDMWSTLLDEAATGKQFPQKNLLVLGDTPASQKQFLELLSNHELRQSSGKLKGPIPDIANSFALGNTYYDVVEADQEQDTLARISAYLLSSPSPSFASLVQPLLTPETIPNTLVVILLNWSRPWMWLRELRQWILLLKKVIYSLSDESKMTLEEVLQSWKDRGRVGSSLALDGSPIPAQSGEGETALPIGQGEWDEGLGLPLCVVCQNTEKMDYLEKSESWKEEQFDLVLQYMRTVLLKHGASLIYTSPSIPSQLQNLVHSSLGIKSLSFKKDSLKPNTIDRDKILVPPNWDSWSKICVLREGFQTDKVSDGWTIDLDQDLPITPANGLVVASGAKPRSPTSDGGIEDKEDSTVVIFEDQIRDPSFDTQLLANQADDAATFEDTIDTQDFLGQQQKALDLLKQKAEAEGDESRRPKDEDSIGYLSRDTEITKKIGPVQINMGGIQADADDMLQRLKDRQSTKEPTSPTTDEAPEDKARDMEKIQAFFTGLISKKKAGT